MDLPAGNPNSVIDARMQQTMAAQTSGPGRAAGFGTERWCADPLVASARHATAAILTAAAVFVTETVCAWCALPQMQTCV